MNLRFNYVVMICTGTAVQLKHQSVKQVSHSQAREATSASKVEEHCTEELSGALRSESSTHDEFILRLNIRGR